MTKDIVTKGSTFLQRGLDPHQQPTYVEGIAARGSQVPKRQDIQGVYRDITTKHKENSISNESSPSTETPIEELSKRYPHLVL